MLNECSKYFMVDDSNMKFHAGDKICRKGDELMASQHYVVQGVYMEKHPFYVQLWYLLKNHRGQNVSSLPQNLEPFIRVKRTRTQSTEGVR